MKKQKKGFRRFIKVIDETVVQFNEVSFIFYFCMAFCYVLLFANPELYFGSLEIRIIGEVVHSLMTACLLLCTIFKYYKKPLYWTNTLVFLIRYIGVIDINSGWHNPFNIILLGIVALYVFVLISIFFAKKVNEGGGLLDTSLLAIGIFFILLWPAFNFEYKWMFIVGFGCCYLYALARVFKNVFYGKSNKELKLIQIIGNIIFYVTMIVGLPFLLEYAGVDSKTIQNTIVPIYAAAIGGIMTLGGVAWTIKKSDKDRKEDDKKKYRPIINFCPIEGEIEGVFLGEMDFVDEKENPLVRTDKNSVVSEIIRCIGKNTDFSEFYLCGIIVNRKRYYTSRKRYVDKNSYLGLKDNFVVYTNKRIKSFSFILEDLLGNEYRLPTKFKPDEKERNFIKMLDTGFVCDIDAEECDERF